MKILLCLLIQISTNVQAILVTMEEHATIISIIIPVLAKMAIPERDARQVAMRIFFYQFSVQDRYPMIFDMAIFSN